MKIGLIDNDLVKRDNHNFPNLAIMKLSSYHKQNGDNVELIGFEEINPMSLFSNDFDLIYVSKAFTDTETPEYIFKMNNVKIGGTGFYFDKAEPLPYEIEHSKPDYDIYKKAYSFIKKKTFFDEYSIGYTTRGCFRQCEFCVNKNSKKVELHSPIDEFYEPAKKKLAMLDDNILGLPNKELYKIFDRLEEINKPFQYRQGMDLRLITKERANRLLSLKYDDIFYFAFDLIENKDLITTKLGLWSELMEIKKPNRQWNRTRLFVFCGFNPNNETNINFWINDLENIFVRFSIIYKYRCQPYTMKHKDYLKSPLKYVYDYISKYTNEPFGKNGQISLNEYIDTSLDIKITNKIKLFRDKYPQFRRMFDAKIL